MSDQSNPPTFPPPRPAMPVQSGTPAQLPDQTPASLFRPLRKKPRAAKPVPKKKRRAKRKAAPAPKPLNPNRPLEAKNQLQRVLTILPHLNKPEQTMFTNLVAALGGLTRNGRQRIIQGLGDVYL